MDNICTRCGEPWDISCVTDAKLALEALKRLKEKRTKFSDMVIDAECFSDYDENPFEWDVDGSTVRKCPSCFNLPNDDPRVQEYRESGNGYIISELADALGDDMDGLCGELEDFGLL